MDPLYTVLLFSHFAGLMMIAASFLALIGMMPGSGADGASTSSRYLTIIGHVGIVLAIVSGPLMIWVRYGGTAGFNHWFWAKMGFLALLVAGIVISARAARKLRGGDTGAAGAVRLGRIIATAALFGVVLTAVLTFG